ncbi:sulfotransferase [Synechococcus sp. M16CYN]|uniref:sulfotransferase family protein n=1 Tax=Synechococcus sp. M16CYN TaxID=3103139 RepID=UPI003251DCF6
MRLPTFVSIGTQKGGTTYLYGLLKQHSQVQMAHPKELHYFSLHYARGLDWYASHFAASEVERHYGEVTPYYLFHPLAAERMAKELPDVKLIVLLRDPVERALSHYFHSRKLNLEPLGLEAAFAAEETRLADSYAVLNQGERHLSHQQHSYLSRSRYEQQLPRFQASFTPEQLLVLRSEDLFEQPHQVWDQILIFLRLTLCQLPNSVTYSGGSKVVGLPLAFKHQLYIDLQPTYSIMQEQFNLSWKYSSL